MSRLFYGICIAYLLWTLPAAPTLLSITLIGGLVVLFLSSGASHG